MRLPHDSATLDGQGEREMETEMLLLTFDTHGLRISFCGVSLNIADLKITVGCCSGVCKTGQFPSKPGNVRRVRACLDVMADSFSAFLLFVTLMYVYLCMFAYLQKFTPNYYSSEFVDQHMNLMFLEVTLPLCFSFSDI